MRTAGVSLDPRFAHFQEQLLTGLASTNETQALRAKARTDAPDGAFAAWVDAWDADHQQLAGVLVRRWCKWDDRCVRPDEC